TRRLLTRGIAIVPAALVTILLGEAQAGKLLIGSQVILSLALPFAMLPLIHLTASRSRLGPLVSPLWLTIVTGAIAVTLSLLNVKLV
ncbi:divalent metal cation transporter, partial [Acinetobacter baumannii]